MVFPLDLRVREGDLVEEGGGVGAQGQRIEGQGILRPRPRPLHDVRDQDVGEGDQIEVEAGARPTKGEAGRPDDRTRGGGEEEWDRALVEWLAEPDTGEGRAPGRG